MRKLFFISVLAVLVLPWLSTAGDGARASRKPPAGVKLIETGSFHGEEIDAQTGEQWLGLYVTKEASALIFSTLNVEQVHDDIGDAPDEQTGKKVGVNHTSNPLFLLRGAKMLQPGAVTTVSADVQSLGNSSDIELKLAGMSYRLKVSTKDKRESEFVTLDDARLVLTDGTKKQILYSLGGTGKHEANTASWQLLWAGDLDGDHKLDLYAQISGHYNSSSRILFLSSQAGKGELLHAVAEFSTWGC